MAATCVLYASRPSLDPLPGLVEIGKDHAGDIAPSVASRIRYPMASASVAPRQRAKRGRVTAVAQYLCYCVVGLSNTLIDLGVLNLLLLMRPARSPLALLLDNTLAVSLAILNSWLWNTRWTFCAQVTHGPRQRVLFAAQALLNVAANNAILLGMTEMLPASQGFSTLIASNLAKLAAMVVASSISFLLLRSLVFVAHPQKDFQNTLRGKRPGT